MHTMRIHEEMTTYTNIEKHRNQIFNEQLLEENLFDRLSFDHYQLHRTKKESK